MTKSGRLPLLRIAETQEALQHPRGYTYLHPIDHFLHQRIHSLSTLRFLPWRLKMCDKFS